MSSEEDIVPGSVVRCVDNNSEHFAIVLKINKNGDSPCLFFSSSPRWSKSFRKATKDEIALAGFHFSKSTYLASAVRPLHHFIATGIKFPEHRREALYREFFKNAREYKTSKL